MKKNVNVVAMDIIMNTMSIIITNMKKSVNVDVMAIMNITNIMNMNTIIMKKAVLVVVTIIMIIMDTIMRMKCLPVGEKKLLTVLV